MFARGFADKAANRSRLVDHIITLQQSLAHYERMLSQSHPTFLSQLRFSVDRAKSDSDKAITFLTVVSLGVVCVQTLIGRSSNN